MTLPPNHPQRKSLNDEVHARPSEVLGTPSRLSYLVLLTPGSLSEADWQPLAALAQRYEAIPPRPGANHYSGDFGPFRLRWERHTEFTRYTFIASGMGENPFADPAIDTVPDDWLAELPGQVLMANHTAVVPPGHVPEEIDLLSARYFSGNVLMGSDIGDGAALTLKDFRIQGDGFSRLLVVNRSMPERQTGLTVQRLLEIDTYRLLALLALPTARAQIPLLNDLEQELAQITTAISEIGGKEERHLLERLTRLQAESESRHAASSYRFSASEAYYALVRRRIEELRETRHPGLQSLEEFTDRRLAPAMNTCQSVAKRQESLSVRAARATQLLSTRVEIASQAQNQSLLEAMNRRAKLQLRLQQTVEGLSVAAISYYIVGLVGYAAKAAKAGGLGIDPALITGLSIPIVALAVAGGVRRIRKLVKLEDQPQARG
ncbi:MAG: DUF3422 family protein [Rhodothalassiaceae bacterium]